MSFEVKKSLGVEIFYSKNLPIARNKKTLITTTSVSRIYYKEIIKIVS
jgi:hypothetical protein